MHPAQYARMNKDAHPEWYCPVKPCLWRTITRKGLVPCANHPAEQTMTAEQADAIRREIYPEQFAKVTA